MSALTIVGMINQAQGDDATARRRYEEALAIDPAAPVAANNLAWMYADAGDNLPAALQLAQAALAAAPEVPEIMDTLGWVHYQRNQPEQAIPLFTQCVEKEPNHTDCRYHLGLALMRAGEAEKGRAELQRALTTSPSPELAAQIRRALEP